MNQDLAVRADALRRQASGLRIDAKTRPHLRYELQLLIDRLEEEANELERTERFAAERAA